MREVKNKSGEKAFCWRKGMKSTESNQVVQRLFQTTLRNFENDFFLRKTMTNENQHLRTKREKTKTKPIGAVKQARFFAVPYCKLAYNVSPFFMLILGRLTGSSECVRSGIYDIDTWSEPNSSYIKEH